MINYSGIIYALMACASWALSFVVPLFITNFSAIEITLGRYFFYGLFSFVLFVVLLLRGQMTFHTSVWKMALVFALAGNIIYYGFEVVGIRYIGSPMVALLFANNPILVSICSNLKEKLYPFKIVLLPMMSVFLGIILVHWNQLALDPEMTLSQFSIGLFFTLSSICLIAWYIINSARFLKKEPIPILTFNTIIGVWCLIISSFFFSLIAGFDLAPLAITSPEVENISGFIVGTLLLGVIASWLGTFCWQNAARLLPTAIAGQIIVAETMCGLTYNYIIAQQLPDLLETTGALLVIGGVLFSMQRIKQYRAAIEASGQLVQAVQSPQ